MKKYYNTLSKEEKAKVKNTYKEEYKNSDLKIRLVRLIIYAIMGYITSIVLYLDAFIGKESKILNITIATTLFIASTIFLTGSIILKQKTLNKIALKNKKK